MPRRSIWSARQRAARFDLPTDEAAPLRHYTRSDDDIEQIRVRRIREQYADSGGFTDHVFAGTSRLGYRCSAIGSSRASGTCRRNGCMPSSPDVFRNP